MNIKQKHLLQRPVIIKRCDFYLQQHPMMLIAVKLSYAEMTYSDNPCLLILQVLTAIV